MRKTIKTVTRIASIILVVGLILTALGLAMGARTAVSNVLSSPNSPTRDAYFSESFSDITSVSIEAGIGTLHVKSGDEFRVEAKNTDAFTCYSRDGVLYVKSNQNDNTANNPVSWINSAMKWVSENWDKWRDNIPEIIVYIPDAARLNNADISVGLGRCSVEWISAESAKITVGAGDLWISEMDIDNIDINVAAGACTIDGVSAEKVNARVQAGNLIIEDLRRVKTLDVSTNAGSADIWLLRGIEYGNFSCNVGNLNITIGDSRRNYTIGTSAELGNIRIDGVSHGSKMPLPDVTPPPRLDSDPISESDRPFGRIDLNCTLGNIDLWFES